MFDPNTFLNQSVTGPLSTKVELIPMGDYRAAINKLEMRKITVENEDRHILRVVWKLMDASDLTAMGREQAYVNQDIFLDLDEAGNLDTEKGKNVGLGRLMETFGLNGGGASVGNLSGQVGMIKINHRPDTKDPSKGPYQEVSRVAALT